jgi:hypothetical protein
LCELGSSAFSVSNSVKCITFKHFLGHQAVYRILKTVIQRLITCSLIQCYVIDGLDFCIGLATFSYMLKSCSNWIQPDTKPDLSCKSPKQLTVLPLWRSVFTQTTKPKCGSLFKHIESSSYQMCADNDACSHSGQFKNHTSPNCQHALVCSDTSGIRWTCVCLICYGNIET